MPVLAKQSHFSNISSDFDKFIDQSQYNLLSILNQFIDINDFIRLFFYQKCYSNFGRKRDFSLDSDVLLDCIYQLVAFILIY